MGVEEEGVRQRELGTYVGDGSLGVGLRNTHILGCQDPPWFVLAASCSCRGEVRCSGGKKAPAAWELLRGAVDLGQGLQLTASH